jgi:hypothetical protein
VTVVDGVKTAVDGKTIKSYPQQHGLSYELADAVVRGVHKLPFHRTYREDGAHCYVVRHGHFVGRSDDAVDKIEKEIAILLSKVGGFFNKLVKYNTDTYEYQIMLSGVPGLSYNTREKIRRLISQIKGIGSAHKSGDDLSAFPSGDVTRANPEVVRAMHNILKTHLPHEAIVMAILAL